MKIILLGVVSLVAIFRAMADDGPPILHVYWHEPESVRILFPDTNRTAHAEFYETLFKEGFAEGLMRTNIVARTNFWGTWAAKGVPVAMTLYSSFLTNDAEAISWLNKAIDSGSAGAADWLVGRFLYARDVTLRDPRKAVAVAERAVQQTGRMCPELLNTLAVAYDANGQYEKAFQAEAEAVAEEPGTHTYAEGLSRIWQRLHNF